MADTTTPHGLRGWASTLSLLLLSSFVLSFLLYEASICDNTFVFLSLVRRFHSLKPVTHLLCVVVFLFVAELYSREHCPIQTPKNPNHDIQSKCLTIYTYIPIDIKDKRRQDADVEQDCPRGSPCHGDLRCLSSCLRSSYLRRRYELCRSSCIDSSC